MRFVDIERMEDDRIRVTVTKGMQDPKRKFFGADEYVAARRFAVRNMGATGVIVEARDIHGALV